MKRQMDKIQFESRAELGELLNALKKYMDEHPNDKNKSVKELYSLLDIMEFEW